MRHCEWFDPHRVDRYRNLSLMGGGSILSHREKQLLRRLARGYSDHAIAREIG